MGKQISSDRKIKMAKFINLIEDLTGIKIPSENQPTFTDEHVKTLTKRCNKISELSLCCTSITNESVNSIIEDLKNTLEKLDLYSTEIEYSKILELKSMSFLKLLNWCPLNRPGCSESYNLKFQFPNLCINEHQMCVKIASPCQKFESR